MKKLFEAVPKLQFLEQQPWIYEVFHQTFGLHQPGFRTTAFVLFLIFAGVLNAFGQTPEARFLEVTGPVETREAASGEWKRAAPGNLIGRNTLISTGPKGSAVIALGSSRLDLRPLTMLTLEELTQRGNTEEASLYLRTGRVRAVVSPPRGRSVDFTVGSPTITASVRGTSFEFDGRRLRVENGLVLLTGSGGQNVYVARAQRSHIDEDNQNRIVPPFEAETASLRPALAELNNTGSDLRVPEMRPGSNLRIGIGWP
jgi:hypothetical protein